MRECAAKSNIILSIK